MLLIQFTGLSGAGKSSIARAVQAMILTNHKQLKVEVIDADDYRKTINKDLAFSKEDRIENIRRLGKIGAGFTAKGFITIIAAINPYAIARAELQQQYDAKTVWINCDMGTLIKRDTKGLYKRAHLALESAEKINNLTGINDPYEAPEDADLVINTGMEDLNASALKLNNFILHQLSI